MEKFLVSVYIPTYNRLNLLKRAIESVRKQTYKNLEIIIVDDGSKDGTVEYLDAISKVDKRIVYFLKKRNTGACESRNIALKNASGYFITGLDDDDYFLENRIEKFVNFWTSLNKKPVFLYSLNAIKREKGVYSPNFFKTIFYKKKIGYKDLRIANYPGNQIFTITNTLREVEGFDVNMPAWQDMETWYRILVKKKGFAIFLNNCSYICDISHEHERITNLDRHKKAREVFIQKHNLDIFESKLFFLLESNNLDYNLYFKRLFFQFSLIDLYYLIKKIMKDFKKS